MDYNKLTFKEKISYGLAGLGQNLTITFVNTFLMTVIYGYMGFTLKSLSILTVILIVAKVWDAVNDPIMGVLIDKIQFKNRGKLRPFILISILPVSILTVMLFGIPQDWSQGAKLAMFGIAYILWDAAYTVCDVPYWAVRSDDFGYQRTDKADFDCPQLRQRGLGRYHFARCEHCRLVQQRG